MVKKIIIIYAVVLLTAAFTVSDSFGGSAQVLPKGVSNIGVSSKFYFTIDERYNQDGETEQVDFFYSTPLDSSVFPELSLVELAFGMPEDSASLGASVVDYEYDFTIVDFNFNYGITDRLTAGITVPYWWVKNEVETELDISEATLGKSAIGTGFGAPLVPLAVNPFGDAVPLTEDDIHDLLGGGLDVNGDGSIDIPGYDFKRTETHSYNDFGDIEVFFKYQYLNTEDWRMSFYSGLTIPSGKIDDPDNLIDYPNSSDSYSIPFSLSNDYTGFKNFTFNVTFEYYLNLPYKESLRVPESIDLPITRDFSEVEIDPGDKIELETSVNYTLAKGLGLSLLYRYENVLRDRVSGDDTLPLDALEDKSDARSHVYIAGISYSTVPLYREKKFAVPLSTSLSYRNRFDGQNALKSQYVNLVFNMYF
jgi:hypothetical protein